MTRGINQAKEAPGRENKPHIGIFGRCNSGKSSLLNFITASHTAIVSPQAGTTTDVVRKSYEILGFAPVIFIDTAGINDAAGLGRQRVARTLETVWQIDLALLVYTCWGEPEKFLVAKLNEASVPYIAVYNGSGSSPDGTPDITLDIIRAADTDRNTLLKAITQKLPESSYRAPSMFEGRINERDMVLLVCPIDSEAPAGRLILPQVQAIRELLDRHAVPVVAQPEEIPHFFASGITPALVVTDSQIFREVRQVIPQNVELTSFSILLAAARGDYRQYLAGLEKVDGLQDDDRILISESCTHQVSCEDIGRVKIPRWLEEYTGRKLRFTTIPGLAPLPPDLADYALMVQCGGCMVTRSQLLSRLRRAAAAGVAVTNYGMLIRKLRNG